MKSRPWLPYELEYLRERYAHATNDILARTLGRSERAIGLKALKLGLEKPVNVGQFKSGLVPWNAGHKGWQAEGVQATQFKPGRPASEARNYVPIGSHRLSKDGYLERKVTDDPALAPARRWVGVHRLVWEAANGPVPAGHAVVFKPGRRTTDPDLITPDAVECITRRELMQRNTVHRYGPEIARVVQLRGAINRQINKLAKEAQKS